MNGNSVTPSSSETLAAIDTGTTLIAGPSDAVANIWSQVEGSQALSGQMAGFFSFRTFFHYFSSPSRLWFHFSVADGFAVHLWSRCLMDSL